jgi:hypothetical protein
MILPRMVCAVLTVLTFTSGCKHSSLSSTRETEDTFALHPCTIPDLGAAQGVEYDGSRLYLFGDVPSPGVGILREYTLSESPCPTPTGRFARLTIGSRNVISHPTGLTSRKPWGTFLGNTVKRVGTIYSFDLPSLIARGSLGAVPHHVIEDDLAVQGTRPEFVRLGDRWLIATGDYGDHTRLARPNAIRLYDPSSLQRASRTSQAGVLVASFPSGPWVQSLHWNDATGELILVQNTTEGLGWRLTYVDLQRSVERAQQVSTRVLTLPPADELEGFHFLEEGRAVFITSSERDNVTIGALP